MATRVASITAGYIAVMSLAGACTSPAGPVGVDPAEADVGGKADGVAALPEITCADVPDAGPADELRHTRSQLVVALGGPHHRGRDLVVSASAEEQEIAGDISYGLLDKALEDEDVDVFACRRGAWEALGRVRTDDEGRFSLVLDGDDRLPVGMRDLYVSVAGDRTGVGFLGVVAPETTELAISDVDGTLTTAEGAFAANVFGIDAAIHDGAPEAWHALAASGRIPVYVTARASRFTEDTRAWLAKKGMPRGAVRLAPHVLLPGRATVDYKSTTLAALAAELPIALGVGNRASDIEAYASVGLPAGRIFVKLPEYEGELAEHLAAGEAIGFPAYPGPLVDVAAGR